MDMKNRLLMLGLVVLAAGLLITSSNAVQDTTINDVHFKVLDGFNPHESDVDTTHRDETASTQKT